MPAPTFPPNQGAETNTALPASGIGTFGDPITVDPASDSAAGSMSIADFNKLATVPAEYTSLIYSFRGALTDLVALADTVLIAAKPGYRAIPLFAKWENITTAGVRTASAAVTAGANAAADELIFNSTANSPNATCFSGGVGAFGALTIINNGASIELTNPVLFRVGTAATGTGGFAWTGYPWLVALLIPV